MLVAIGKEYGAKLRVCVNLTNNSSVFMVVNVTAHLPAELLKI